MIRVHLDLDGKCCELIAVFDNEGTYMACLPGLEHQAIINRARLVESVTDEDINDYEEKD